MRRSSIVWISVFLLYFSLITVPAAHAYVDPGTGSYIFQVVIGAMLGAAVAIKLFWRRLVGLVVRRPAKAGERAHLPEAAPGPTEPE